MEPRTIKCLLIGNTGVGKTSLRMRYVQNEFKTDWQESTWPITYETAATRTIEGEAVRLNVMEAVGNEEYDRLRPLCYPLQNVVIFCYAVNDIEGFERIRTKLIDEVCSEFIFGVPMVLLGLKSDLLQNTHDETKFVTPAMVRDLAKKQKIETTDTCSALTGDNVENVFENAVIMYFKSLKRIRPQPSCTVV